MFDKFLNWWETRKNKQAVIEEKTITLNDVPAPLLEEISAQSVNEFKARVHSIADFLYPTPVETGFAKHVIWLVLGLQFVTFFLLWKK